MDLVCLTLRKHPVTSWTFIGCVTFLALVTAANQTLEFLKMVGVICHRGE